VVLATAIELPENAKKLAQTLGLQFCGSNFFKELHPKLGPVETSTQGIFLAGCCQGPKDIPDTVSQAKGAAAAAAGPWPRAGSGSSRSSPRSTPRSAQGCGICIPLCPYDAISMHRVREPAQGADRHHPVQGLRRVHLGLPFGGHRAPRLRGRADLRPNRGADRLRRMPAMKIIDQEKIDQAVQTIIGLGGTGVLKCVQCGACSAVCPGVKAGFPVLCRA
jgi:ferredoxin